jgi:large subunit ribosomal protein L21
MYAIVISGGKQYRAEQGELLLVDLIEGEPGSTVTLESVVMVCDNGKCSIGSPFVKGAKVKGEIVRQVKAKKINGFNYKPKKNERKRWGHRQPMTQVRVTEVTA